MRINILMGGEASQGINVAASLVSRALSRNGYYTFNYRDYPSLIKGGHNFNIISVSDKKIGSYESRVDVIAALDNETLEKHKGKLKDDGTIIKLKDLNMQKKYKKVANVFMAGALVKTLGLGLEGLKKEIEKEFKGKKLLPLDLEAAENGHRTGNMKRPEDLSKLCGRKKLKNMTGSEAIAKGAMDSGIDCYFAYPMTPATPVLHLLAGSQKDFLVFQPENELAAINMGLGAGHAGAKAMVGTSGGGYDLMQESLSMQGMSEIPLVVYLAQRPGPASGVPTYTSQGDLHIAVKGGHGEFPRVVVAPGDAKEAGRLTNEAFYFSEKYRVLSVILGDKHLAESGYTFDDYEHTLSVKRNISHQKGGFFKNYKITRNGNSPRSVSGLTIVKSSSYEHDEKGITTEDPKTVKNMNDKRLRKGGSVREETKNFERYKIHGKGNVLVVGWGSTKGAIQDAIKNLGVSFLQILYMSPFPKEIKKELEKSEKVILVENNSTGLLGDLIAEKTGFLIPKKNKILRYDGRPFESDELEKEIKGVING